MPGPGRADCHAPGPQLPPRRFTAAELSDRGQQTPALPGDAPGLSRRHARAQEPGLHQHEQLDGRQMPSTRTGADPGQLEGPNVSTIPV